MADRYMPNIRLGTNGDTGLIEAMGIENCGDEEREMILNRINDINIRLRPLLCKDHYFINLENRNMKI